MRTKQSDCVVANFGHLTKIACLILFLLCCLVSRSSVVHAQDVGDGSSQLVSNYFSEIWDRQISSRLVVAEWSSSYLYNAGLYFSLPLKFAFESGIEPYQDEFRSHFGQFTQQGFASDLDWLSQAQYAHLVSDFIYREMELYGQTELTEQLQLILTEFLLAEWSSNTISEWSDFVYTGRVNSISAKLESGLRPVTDGDLFLFSIAADLVSYAEGVGQTPNEQLLDILMLANSVYAELGVFDASGNWLFDENGWKTHPDYALSNWDGTGEIPLDAPIMATSWDISHSYRFPYWLTSLNRAAQITGIGNDQYSRTLAGLVKTVENRALYLHGGVDSHWATSNYLSGVNGIYRLAYQSFLAGDGYLPGGLSGTLLQGSWSVLDSELITGVYEDLSNLNNFSPALLELYKEPIRSSEPNGQFDWDDILESGDTKLWTSIAAGLHTELSRGAPAIEGVNRRHIVPANAPTALLPLIEIDSSVNSIQIYATDRFDSGNRIVGVGGQLSANTVHVINSIELGEHYFITGENAYPSRLYWRTIEPEISAWRSVDLVRTNEPMLLWQVEPVVVSPSDRVYLSDFIDIEDSDGDTVALVQVYDASTEEAGMFVDDQSIPIRITQTISSTQWTRLQIDATTGRQYFVRVTDGASWSDWLTVTVEKTAGNASFEVIDQTLFPNQWVRAETLFQLSGTVSTDAANVEFRDNMGRNSIWENGDYVDAKVGYRSNLENGIWLQADAESSTQSLDARVKFESQIWSDWKSFSLITLENTPPSITLELDPLLPSQWVRVDEVLQFQDPDGDSLQRLQLWDDDGSDSWWVSGSYISAANGFVLDTLSGVWLQAEADGSEQTVWVRASDGNQWGAWSKIEVLTLSNSNPIISVADFEIYVDEVVSLQDVMSYNDPEDDQLSKVQLWDDEGVANWYVNGASIDTSRGHSTSDISEVTLQSPVAHGRQAMWVRANDGYQWSDWVQFNLGAIAR